MGESLENDDHLVLLARRHDDDAALDGAVLRDYLRGTSERGAALVSFLLT